MSTILIVEDDTSVIGYLYTVLRGAGYPCVTAPNAERARKLLTSLPDIGLLLLDHNLGDRSDDGLTFLTELRKSPPFDRLPVIICSGNSRPDIVTGFLGNRITDFIKKPVRPERLLSDVQKVLGPPPAPPPPRLTPQAA